MLAGLMAARAAQRRMLRDGVAPIAIPVSDDVRMARVMT
jgi:hypothetical protein